MCPRRCTKSWALWALLLMGMVAWAGLLQLSKIHWLYDAPVSQPHGAEDKQRLDSAIRQAAQAGQILGSAGRPASIPNTSRTRAPHNAGNAAMMPQASVDKNGSVGDRVTVAAPRSTGSGRSNASSLAVSTENAVLASHGVINASGARGSATHLPMVADSAGLASRALGNAAATIGSREAAARTTAADRPLARKRLGPSIERRKSMYSRHYEQAVSDGWDNELMDDPMEQGSAGPADGNVGLQAGPAWREEAWDQGGGAGLKPGPRWRAGSELPDAWNTVGEGGCVFSKNVDYVGGIDLDTVTGLSAQACCDLCKAKAADYGCQIAVLSSPWDEPPKACWLKRGVTQRKMKDGVIACEPPHDAKSAL